MIDQEKAFELIEKARKYKKSYFGFLEKNGYSHKEAIKYVSLYRDQKSTVVIPKSNLIYSEKDDSATIESGSIKDLDTLLKEAKVDLNVWAVDRYLVNKWESSSKDCNDEIQVTPLWQIKVWLKKKENADTAKELVEWFKEELTAAIPRDKWVNIKSIKNDLKKKYCLELGLPDAHLGKLAWSSETRGENYDSKIAIDIFKKAVNDLISKAPMNQVDQILFPCGSDYFHTDNEKDETTAGTWVGSDTRWQKIFVSGCQLLVDIITELGKLYKVHVPIIAGNHDFHKSFYMGEYLKAIFQNHPNVIIDNSPATRKYFKYGNTLLGFCHGSEEKVNSLPLILAHDCKKEWSEAKYHEFHIGHKHQKSSVEYDGVMIRFLASLCSSDSWHAKKGFIGANRSAVAFLWDFENGLEAEYYFNI